MEELTKSQKARMAIRIFKTTADALALRGYYKPSGKSGQTLAEALRMLSPEIYGTMNDPRIIELKGLEYVIERLPRGIESCNRIILTAQEDLEETSFERIVPSKRRRTSYRIGEKEMCFVITRGLSEIYDVLSHLTFLALEGEKIKKQIRSREGEITPEWRKLEGVIQRCGDLSGEEMDRALWNLSIILGRTYQETRLSYLYLDGLRRESHSHHGLFRFVHDLGMRALEEDAGPESMQLIYFTPTLRDMIGHHRYGEKWASDVKSRLCGMGFGDRPLHIISANLHSILNALYGYGAVNGKDPEVANGDFYGFMQRIRDHQEAIRAYALEKGFLELPDRSDTHIDCQIIDTEGLASVPLHPDLRIPDPIPHDPKPVILVMDYAFGTQAFEVMDELLAPCENENGPVRFPIRSISVMGKAGTLPGKKGDIMLATAHVFEGTPHNYIFENDLKKEDFDADIPVHVGPILTVLGTSLQNRDMLKRFQKSSWEAVGLEMEGGHYHRAIGAAMIRGHISKDVKVRYAYYASDNPLVSGQTLASGSMGMEGIRPTYMITRVILEKILS
jgi:hypothetical protein